jgi:hypothetical protein
MRISAVAAAVAVILGCAAPVAAQEEPPRTDQVSVVYGEPKDAKHAAIRREMQDRGVLETVGAILNAFRLPRDLTVEVKSCDGRETAWYGFGRANFCYEYVELIQRHSPRVATPGGVRRSDAIIGSTIDTILHEAGHGIIEILDIPVLGREEDAADFFSIYLMLQFPPEEAHRLIQGTAFSVGSEAREDFQEKVKPELFAGAHGANATRHYNVLCLAYGARPEMFNNVPPPGLSHWRARNCGSEWSLLDRAFRRLILPHIDEAKLRAAIAQARFKWSPLAAASERLEKFPLENLNR